MRTATRVLILLLLLSAGRFGEAVCDAQTIADAVTSVPQRLRTLALGASVAEAQRTVGETKAMGSPTDPKFMLFVYFTPPEAWDAAMLEFTGGRLTSISLLLGVARENTFEKSQKALSDVVEKNSARYRPLVTLNSSMQPVPGYVWDKANAEVFAVGPSAALRDSTREVVPADSTFRVGVTRSGRAIDELVQMASDAQIRDFLFKALSTIRQR